MVRLAEVASINPTLGDRLNDDDFVAFLGMADVSENGSTTVGENRMYSDVSTGYTPFRNEDLLVAKITPCFENGKIAQAEIGQDMGFGSTEFHVVRPDPSMLDARYALHFLRSPRVRQAGQLRMTGSGGQRRVPRAFIEDLEIPLPPLPEQRRIASILDQAATIAALRNRAVELIDAMTGSIFNERFAQLDGPAIRLEELLVDKKDAIRTGPFGSQMLVEEFVDEGVQVLGIDNVRNNVFAGGSNRHITPQKYRELERYTVLAGDVLITIMGTVGRVCVVPEGIPLSISSKHLCALTLRRDEVRPEYVQAYVLNHPRARLHLNQTQKGAIMAGLNMSIIKDLPVMVPPLSEQERFVADLATVSTIREQAQLHEDQIRLLTDSLATRAFKGEL